MIYFVQIFLLNLRNYHFGMNFHLKDAYVRQFFTLMIPVIVGVSVNEVNTLVDRTVASQVAEGGISALTYANSLIQFVQGGHEGIHEQADYWNFDSRRQRKRIPGTETEVLPVYSGWDNQGRAVFCIYVLREPGRERRV